MLGILGGRVYDPRNGKDGEVGDIWVKDGRVVAPEDVDREAAQTVDAAGLVVMPGGVDIHAHIVGGEVNARSQDAAGGPPRPRARALRALRAGAGGTVPSTLSHRLSLLRARLHHGDAGVRRAPGGAAHPRGARGRAQPRQGRVHRHGQQPLRHAVHRRQAAREGARLRGLAPRSEPRLRDQGREPRRRRELEVGQERRRARRRGDRLRGHPAADRADPGHDRRRSRPAALASTSTASTSAGTPARARPSRRSPPSTAIARISATFSS